MSQSVSVSYVSACIQLICWFSSNTSRQENLLAKRLAGWRIGEESNPAVIKILLKTVEDSLRWLRRRLVGIINHHLPSCHRTSGGGRCVGSIERLLNVIYEKRNTYL